jgi:hypothetical protein
MKNRLLCAVLAASAVALTSAAFGATYQVLHGTFGNGGGVRAAGGYICYDTAGQPVIGIVAGASNIVKAGFWYCAGISSTVDVAITSLFGELKDDAVVLSWSTSASTSFDGFNVYRSEDAEETFVKLNVELIPAGREASYIDETALGGATYLYRIGAVSDEGEVYSQNISLSLPPKPAMLYQNYPNPFNPSTAIAYYLPRAGGASLVIYDVAGRSVRTLADGPKSAGRHTVLWDGTNDNGAQVGSGVFYYRLRADKVSITKKLVIIR